MSILNKFIKYSLVTIFSIFLLISLIIKPMYNFEDYPFFVKVNFYDYVIMIIFVLGIFFISKHIKNIDARISKKTITIIYFCSALIFILIFPLKTFSDMEQVLNGAISFSNFDFISLRENIYFITNPNNIFIAILYGIIFIILPKNIITIKIINIVMILLIAKINCNIFELYYKKYSNILFLISLSIISVFIYVNHIYTDVPFTLISIFAIYIYFKDKKNIWISSIILVVSYFIRPLGIIYLIAIFVDFILLCKIDCIVKIKYSIITLFGVILIFCTISNILIPFFVQKDVTKQIPASSYIYMAFNEEEFGFQDGSHSNSRSLNEVRTRLKGYSAKQITKIVCKKTYWMWMEGTYQAQRYGFGGDCGEEYLEKYDYSTKVIKFFANSDNKARIILNSIMYVQYVVFWGLMILGIVKTNNSMGNVINLIFMGFFIFYIFWEIKSRYIFSLYPLMLMYAVIALCKIKEQKN